MKVAEIGIPLVLSPNTFPIVIFQAKCHPITSPNRPCMTSTLIPATVPPMKMFNILAKSLPPGDGRWSRTKKEDWQSMAIEKATKKLNPKLLRMASVKL
mmetsp:Transcript_58381/g.123850  ORF Transcript_58381/g.123850 Transcript_58381/m.123850 type:complete len:99 (-) Transcript_58381:863-1159(-)